MHSEIELAPTDLMSKAIASRLRTIRRSKGFSQSKLARTVGMTETTIQRAEAAKGIPEWRTLGQFAEALGVSLWDLIPSEDEAGPLAAETDERLAKYAELRGWDSNPQPTGYGSMSGPHPMTPTTSTRPKGGHPGADGSSRRRAA